MRRHFPKMLLCLALSFSLFTPRSAFSEQTFTYAIQPAFDRAFDFSEGVARVQSGDFFTFIDASGKVTLSQQFKGLTRLSEGLAGATIDNVQWGIIDTSGKFVVEPKFGRISVDSFSSGMAAFLKGAKWGYINTKGEEKIEPQFQFAGPFDEGIAPVRTAGAFLFIDKSAKPVIASKDRFEYASAFKDGIATVVSKGNVLFIDKTGKVLLSKEGLGGFPFQNGLAPFMAGFDACGFIDKTGKLVIPAQYPIVWPFSEGFAAFKDSKTNLWGFLDTTGKQVIPPTFEMALSFVKVSNGKILAAVKEPNKKWGFISPTH